MVRARQLTHIEKYLERYGGIVQGETEWNVEALIRLAQRRGGVDAVLSSQLRLTVARLAAILAKRDSGSGGDL